MKSVINLIIKSDRTNADSAAVNRISRALSERLSPLTERYFARSYIFRRLAADITGSAARKEKAAALFLDIPSILAPSMVAPEREVPGIIASD